MAWTRGNSAVKGSGSAATTTDAFDASSGTLLWAACVTYGSGATVVFSDSGTNTWQTLTPYLGVSGATVVVIGYAVDKAGGALSLSASHTVTATATSGSYTSVFAGVCAGATLSSVVENGSTDLLNASGTVTPGAAGDWVLSVSGNASTSVHTAASGMTIFRSQTNSSYCVGACADLVSADTSAFGTTWSGGNNGPVAIACFKAAAGGGATAIPIFLNLQRQFRN